ncbi:vWA domain-containing protein [Haloplanus rubicundus]|uniref:VWA domain-containing protein n=1 Tax=Haloplanus rubicundus TaxID=1547898 RepID=A0A345E857_9EURY|nr:VWA domain-containing protein [Haloplanus rubicundus]AXG08379.1 VWA domain-containing protein [Haloplanus rubicundus]
MTATLRAEVDREFPKNGGKSVVEVVVEPLVKERQTRRQVVLVVDASGSMDWGVDGTRNPPDGEAKMDWAREGMLSVLDELESDDLVSIVSFASSSEVHLEMTRWGDADQQDVQEMVAESDEDAEIHARGGTDIYDALVEARSQFTDLSGSGIVSRDVVLLSDGLDNRDLDDFEDLAAEMSVDGISISAGGIGEDYKEDVLLSLTKNSGGKPAHIVDGDDIQGFLEDRIREAGDTIATNPTLRVDFGNPFYAYEEEQAVFAAPSRQSVPLSFDGDDVVIPFPDKLIAGEEHRLTFEVLGTPNQTGITYSLADVKLRDDDDRTIATASVEATYTDDPEKRAHIEKEREAAKVRAEMSEPDADEAAVKDQIDDLEKQGFEDTAEKLRADLDDIEDTGDKIRKSRVDQDDDDADDDDANSVSIR